MMHKLKETFTPGHEEGGTATGTTGTTQTAGYGGTTTGTGTGTTTGTTERTSYGTTGTTGTEAHTWTTQPTAYETTTATATGERGYTERAQVAKDVVCGQEYFTKTEDRPVVKEVIETIREHHPVEKEYVVETRATGVERELFDKRTIEHLGTVERVVEHAKPMDPRS